MGFELMLGPKSVNRALVPYESPSERILYPQLPKKQGVGSDFNLYSLNRRIAYV